MGDPILTTVYAMQSQYKYEQPDFQSLITESRQGGARPIIWDIMDWIIDDVVGYCPDMLIVDRECEAIHDYVIAKCIPIPSLYEWIFDGRGGFLTLTKGIMMLEDDWQKLAETDICMPYDPEFIEFLQSDPKEYVHVLHSFGSK